MARTGEQLPVTQVLDNGLPVIYLKIPGSVECCGVAIMAGSRDESDAEHGLAHFVEHTLFKGTARRRPHHIINRMESVGGELNAYTTKEETYVYALAPAHNAARAVELIADLVTGSRFPDKELDKEREVVADEISCYLDQPDAAVYDDFEDIIFAGSSLGHNILGTKDTIVALHSDDCRRWVSENYHAGRMAFFYAGPASCTGIFKLAEKYLSKIPASGKALDRAFPMINDRFDVLRNIGSHQAHTIAGARFAPGDQESRDVMTLCNNMLGGPGMNSRFNVSLRERKGLVYTVESAVSWFSDCALWTVYFGCDPEHVGLCRELVDAEMKKLALEPLTERALARAKRQLLGQHALSRAAVENSALALGRCALRRENYRSDRQIAADFGAISPDALQQAAQMLIADGLSALTFA